MKNKIITFTSIIALLSFCDSRSVFAKRPPAPAGLPAPAAPAEIPLPPLTPIPDTAAAPAIPAPPEEVLLLALAQDAKPPVVDVKAAIEAAAQNVEALALGYDAAAKAYQDVFNDDGAMIAHVLTKDGARDKSLMIQSSNIDRKEMAEMEEDFSVMTRILEKAVARESTKKSGAKAMGIFINADMFGSSSVQNIYLDGYGAVFFMNVKFPLIAPPQKKEETKEEPATDSTWDQTKRELYGHRDSDFFPKTFKTFSPPAEEYDAEKVDKLKAALLEALKNASNIRHVKPDEFITVTVSGPSNGSAVRSAGGWRPRASSLGSSSIAGGGGGEGRGGGEGDGHAANFTYTLTTAGTRDNADADTLLTVRVKKSDADDFAKNKLSADEFRKKASIQAYSTSGGAGAGHIGARTTVRERLLRPASPTPAPAAPKTAP